MGIKKGFHYRVYSFILVALLVVNIFIMMALPVQVLAVEGDITVSGSGLNNSELTTITQKQLYSGETLPSKLPEVYGEEPPNQYDERYNTINTGLRVKESTAPVTLEIYPEEAKIGDEITLSGNANPNIFVSIKVVDSKGNVVYFDGVKSGSDGKYSTTFIVPDDIEGDLTIVAGYGEKVEAKILGITEGESVDKSELRAVVDGALGLDEKDYTMESWAAFVEVLENAQIVLANKGATQKQVDSILASLEEVISTLVEIEEPINPLLPAPKLRADATDNFVDEPVELTFKDDRNWRENIIGVYVDNQKLRQYDYEIDAGVITISEDLFMFVGNYSIVVKAVGYRDATIILRIKEGSTVPGDGDIVLEIIGEGIANSMKYTQSQLEAMPQIQEVYSCVNTWPTKQWYIGKGVALSYLLGSEQADIKSNATLIRFTSKDGYYMTLTVEELLEDSRYCFPNFKTGNDADGHIPGSTKGKVRVETILALTSTQSDNPGYMNELDALHLMLGQRAVTEQTGPLFVKNVNKVEVLSGSIPKWDVPEAEPSGGTVPIGTEVRLSNKNMDQDKIHYTTDGSTPTLDSPIYNWVAKRWWSARGDETVEKINHPIEITEDTVIKAVTIGAGKRNSGVATFTYKVEGTKPDASHKIKPDKGGTVSLGHDVVMEIPAGALLGTDDLDVEIERVKDSPAIPVGFKLLSDVYEIRVDGRRSYNFAKKVKIKFSFDSDAFDYDQAPAVHYYDEARKNWVNIGGKVSGSTISVEVDHLTKYGVLVSLPADTTAGIKPSRGGKLNLGEEVTIEIPAGALTGTDDLEVKIERVKEPPAVPAGFKLLSDVFEIHVDGKKSYNFAKKVKIKFSFDSNDFDYEQAPAIHYYDEARKSWVNIGGEVSGSTISVEVDHLAKFAVMASLKSKELQLRDIIGHWAQDDIKRLVASGAINGYPDNSFKPDNNITRAEFTTVFIKTLELPPQNGKVFADTADHWACDMISTAAHHGIVNGYDDNTFGPDEPITREQMVTMIVRATELAPETGELGFADNDRISDWARGSMITAVKNGIINGYPDNTVRPQGLATRAEAATIVVRVLDR